MSRLRDELASVKIDSRRACGREGTGPRLTGAPSALGAEAGRARVVRAGALARATLAARGGGCYGYTRWQEIRSKVEVTTAVVQAMTTARPRRSSSALRATSSRGTRPTSASRSRAGWSRSSSRRVAGPQGDLAVLEHTDIDAQLASRPASVQRAKADLLEAEADLDEKARKQKRTEKLAERSMVSVEERGSVAAAYQQIPGPPRQPQGADRVPAADGQADRGHARRHVYSRAPFDGTIVKKEAEVGEMIAGSGGRSNVATIANLSRMDVETDVGEKGLTRLSVGQPAIIEVSAVPDQKAPEDPKRYRGRVRQIIPMSDRGRGTVKVMVEFLEPDEHLFPELACETYDS